MECFYDDNLFTVDAKTIRVVNLHLKFSVWCAKNKMETEFLQYLIADSSEPAIIATENISNTSYAEPEWVSVPEVCRKDMLHLYVDELGELACEKGTVDRAQVGTCVVEKEPKAESEQVECKQEVEDEECTYLELKTVPKEAYRQIHYGGADGYSYVKNGQSYVESYRDEFGFYVSSLPDSCKDPAIPLSEDTVLKSEVEQYCSFEGESGSDSQSSNVGLDLCDSLVEPQAMIENNVDNVSLMKLRLHRIISNSEKSIEQTTSKSEDRLNKSKVTTRPVNVRVDVPVRKMSCPLVSQIAATILDKWKNMRPLGVTGLGDLPKNPSTSRKAKLIGRPGPAGGARRAAGEGPGAERSPAKGTRAARALDRRRESQLALQQLQQMSKPAPKRRGRPASSPRTAP
ncbi:uncharacterized protein LOC134534911 isoform X2 [Bacillus rossius redtenbacheri]|uniref:uncharacterized protein LOC134534911 isoform X2 n=1 Tax=Bacillus rossius redtenbacheri TaxID=93214 RepID=UPI002FDEE203